MKQIFALILATAFCLLFSLSNSRGQGVTPGGSLGDTAVFIAASAGEELLESSTPDTPGPVIEQTFDTTVGVADGSYILNPSGSDATEIALSSGLHLVLYNAQFNDDSPNPGNARTEVQSILSLDGSDLAIGASQGYTRDTSGAKETITTGGAIIDVAADDDILKVKSFRTDVNSAQNLQRVDGSSAVQLLKLDDPGIT